MNRKRLENIIVPNKTIHYEMKQSFLYEWTDYIQKQHDFSNDELSRDLDNKYGDIIHNFEKYNEQYFNDKFRCITKVFGIDTTYKEYSGRRRPVFLYCTAHVLWERGLQQASNKQASKKQNSYIR